MQEEPQKPFSDVLDALFNEEQVPVHLLFRLSDMLADEKKRFFAAWAEGEDDRRQEIMRHLADLAEDNFVVDFSPIFVKGLTDSLAGVRQAGLDGLWDATDVRLIPWVLGLMQTDEDQDVRATAASTLAHYVLLSEWGQIPQRPLEPAIAALLAAYEDEETAVPIRRSALEALGAANHPRVPALIEEAYENDDPAMQLSAIFAMGNSADPRWLPTILAEMTNPSADMRAEAAQAAGTIGGSDAISQLAELTQDDDEDVRAAAIVALGMIGGDDAQMILSDLLEDPDFEDLREIIQESLEVLLLMGGELNLLSYLNGDDDYEEDDEDYEFDDHDDAGQDDDEDDDEDDDDFIYSPFDEDDEDDDDLYG